MRTICPRFRSAPLPCPPLAAGAMAAWNPSGGSASSREPSRITAAKSTPSTRKALPRPTFSISAAAVGAHRMAPEP